MWTGALAALAVGAVLTVAPAGQTAKPGLDIVLRTTPNPPKTGMNAVEVVVKDPAGAPVTDADVNALFIMPAMPSMNMPEMKSNVVLKHVKGGAYAGNGQVMMAGKWDVTVTVKRSGRDLGSKKFPITAR
jgi:hypothetical protein